MLLLPATIQNLRTLADKSWRIQIDTQELSVAQASQLMDLHQNFGWFAFSTNPDENVEIPDEPAPEFKTDHSPSKRLRNTLYVYWSENTNKKQNFDDFWKNWVEKKINEIKDYLPSKE